MGLTWPQLHEYPAGYAPYLAGASSEDGLTLLQRQLEEVDTLFAALSEAQGAFRYAPGKWSLKDLLQHVTDAERIFTYRCLRIGRGDATPLPGFDENAYAEAAQAEGRSLAELRADWRAARAAMLTLCQSLSDEAWAHQGTSNGKTLTARCIPFICLGHVAHHLAVIRERYLPGLR